MIMKHKFNRKQIKEVGKIILINLLLLGFFVELGSLGFYLVRHNQLFYTRQRPSSIEEMGLNLEGMRMEISIVERLHPYFGYAPKPGPDFRPGFKYNNYGFISPYNYPFVKTNENQFIVGVFGGSVASNYSIYEIQNGILETKIREVPGLENKELIILSFATGGYKQPQQLLILNYLLSVGQVFDMVINIDGFNELALSSVNNEKKLELTMPSASHIQPLTNLANNSLSTQALESILKIKQAKPRINQVASNLKNCWMASCYTINNLAIQGLIKDYYQEVERFQRYQQIPDHDGGEGSVFLFYTQESVLPEEKALAKITDTWVRTSTVINHILSAKNIPYFHILQPNQYHVTNRVFSSEEKAIAFTDNTPYRQPIVAGYPLLLNRIADLEAAGVTIFNGVNIFDAAPEMMYIDNCCHYTPAGEHILSSYVAESIKNILNQRLNPPNLNLANEPLTD